MGEVAGKPQMMWPDHCVQYTLDSELHPELKAEEIDLIQQKGEDPRVDSYSAFRDNDHDASTGLSDFLEDQGVTDLDVCGLATDYCVKFSAIDALDMIPGVRVRFIEDASRGITPEGVATAIAEMKFRGIAIIDSRAVLEG
jgi:nicotinamidase/pyrazinamidase